MDRAMGPIGIHGTRLRNFGKHLARRDFQGSSSPS